MPQWLRRLTHCAKNCMRVHHNICVRVRQLRFSKEQRRELYAATPTFAGLPQWLKRLTHCVNKLHAFSPQHLRTCEAIKVFQRTAQGALCSHAELCGAAPMAEASCKKLHACSPQHSRTREAIQVFQSTLKIFNYCIG